MREYEWDPRKAAENWRKHGVDFAVATTVLADDDVLTREDPDADGEQRFVSLGMAADGRILVVAWCWRDETIRVFSARRANRWEQVIYRAG